MRIRRFGTGFWEPTFAKSRMIKAKSSLKDTAGRCGDHCGTRCFGATGGKGCASGMNDVRLPTYDEVARVPEQLDVYEARFDESLFVAGPPGSGKTVLAIHRARLIAAEGMTVVFVTYNRMLRRLATLLLEGGVQARTMHKFVSDHYCDRTQHLAPEVGVPYSYDWSTMFDEMRKRRVGADSIYMIVDEGQDLPKPFFQYVREFVATNMTVFADEDQALTDERSTLAGIKEAADLGDPVLLSGNHRNRPEVARVAEHFHVGGLPVLEVRRKASGELPSIVLYGNLEEAAERIANWHMARGRRVGVVVHRNDTGVAMQEKLRRRLQGRRVDFYSHAQRNEDAIELLEPGVTVLNEKSIKGQEFDAVFVMEVECFLRCAGKAGSRVMYMLCSRARDNLILMHEGSRLPSALLSQFPRPALLSRP